MELSLRSSVEAQVEGDGAVVVPGRLLVDLVRLLPGDEVTFEQRPEEGVLHVSCGPSSSTLHTYAAEDFPRLPDLDAVGTFTVVEPTVWSDVVEPGCTPDAPYAARRRSEFRKLIFRKNDSSEITQEMLPFG